MARLPIYRRSDLPEPILSRPAASLGLVEAAVTRIRGLGSPIYCSAIARTELASSSPDQRQVLLVQVEVKRDMVVGGVDEVWLTWAPGGRVVQSVVGMDGRDTGCLPDDRESSHRMNRKS